MEKLIFIETINQLHQLAGLEASEHPLFAIDRLENLPELPQSYPINMVYGFYSLSIKRNLNSYIKYGRRTYDFQQGVMGFTAPNQVVSYQQGVAKGASGWMMFFHTDLLAKHPLGEKIHKYGFFGYEVNEALHLSQKEEDMLEGIFENIYQEYKYPIDKFSKSVVLSNLELLLTYSQRYYNRQFILREDTESSLLSRFEKELMALFSEEILADRGLPTVGEIADRMGLSPNYLSDSLRELTGKNTQEHIHFQLIRKAKEKLLASEKSIAEVAYELGFEYPQYFSRLFKEKTGMTPRAYRVEAY